MDDIKFKTSKLSVAPEVGRLEMSKFDASIISFRTKLFILFDDKRRHFDKKG